MLQKVKNRLKDQRGLTLIELLAVIVILGIIAAIAVPSIMGVISNSKEDAVKSDAIQIYNAAKLYVASEGTSSTIEWDDLKSYVDIGITATAATGDGKNDYLDVDAIVPTTGDIKLTGVIQKDGKKLTMTAKGATLKQIQEADFNSGAATVGEQ